VGPYPVVTPQSDPEDVVEYKVRKGSQADQISSFHPYLINSSSVSRIVIGQKRRRAGIGQRVLSTLSLPTYMKAGGLTTLDSK
jgi:hypothetical protein